MPQPNLNKPMTDAEIEVEGKRIAAWWQSLTPEQQDANQNKLFDLVFGEVEGFDGDDIAKVVTKFAEWLRENDGDIPDTGIGCDMSDLMLIRGALNRYIEDDDEDEVDDDE